MIKHNTAEHTRSLAAYMPDGKMFEAKNIQGSNFNQLLRGLAEESRTAEGYLLTLEDEYFPDNTVLFLGEWEQAVGIPDDCFPGTGDADERRSHILTKLSSLGIQTADEFVVLAALFGVAVTVESGSVSGAFPMVFPITFFDASQPARYTIVVTFTVIGGDAFPFEFPFTFGSAEIAILECLFSKLKPANCGLIFKQI